MSVLDLPGDAERGRITRREQPETVSPMLATVTRDGFSDDGWIFEKYGGERSIVAEHATSTYLGSRSADWPRLKCTAEVTREDLGA